MHKLTMDFLQEQYKKTKLLRSSDKGEVWLVTQKDDTPAIMRIINHIGVPGNLLRDNPHTLWPRILYFAEDEAQQRTIIVEEYIGGQSMQEYLQNGGNLSEAEAQKFLLDFCYGLSHLHKLGIVHRDIKPSNIIRQSSGGFKLIDFDVARLRNTKVEDQDTVLLGTRGYAPPEQYGYSQTDRRSDLYSLGVTVDELLGEEYKGYLRPVIRKCCALDPAMRYQSAEEVIRAIKLRRGFKIAMPMVVGTLLLMALTVIWLISGYKAPDKEKIPAKATQSYSPWRGYYSKIQFVWQFPEFAPVGAWCIWAMFIFWMFSHILCQQCFVQFGNTVIARNRIIFFNLQSFLHGSSKATIIVVYPCDHVHSFV